MLLKTELGGYLLGRFCYQRDELLVHAFVRETHGGTGDADRADDPAGIVADRCADALDADIKLLVVDGIALLGDGLQLLLEESRSVMVLFRITLEFLGGEVVFQLLVAHVGDLNLAGGGTVGRQA